MQASGGSVHPPPDYTQKITNSILCMHTNKEWKWSLNITIKQRDLQL